ncbi:hypothetical protein VTO42DRAFT_5834 [Malbranchea cinnamomea]
METGRQSASPGRGTETKSRLPRPYIPVNSAFYLCLVSNTLAAFLAPIQDCDEVFNYWEPTHYLTHGYGLQTWEYSPEYSIRSWLYISLHAMIAKSSLLFTRTKTGQFYFVRMALAFICTMCETRLYAVISRTLGRRIGVFFLMIMLFSPGMAHSSVALLPSSFAMYTSMLGLSAFLDMRGGLNTPKGILWFGIGAVIGWPFAGALVLPFLLDEAVVGVRTGTVLSTISRILRGAFRCLLVLFLEITVDTAFYHKLVVVPWNIVSYNVFGGPGKGPDIFGTETWSFYFRNLLLNFNLWFVLALFSGPLLFVRALFRAQRSSKEAVLRSVTYVLPFYMWLAIFTIQPHKEERFMYPAYPFLALNAAIALHLVLAYLGSSNPGDLVTRISLKVRFIAIASAIILAVNIGLLRAIGLVTAYNAPLQVFRKLEEPSVAKPGDFVCLGKEWYRFPSSFFLPNDVRAKFIKSHFDGLLPGEFAEKGAAHGPFPGTWLMPSGMNDRNEEDPGKYVDISQCSFLVDSYFLGDEESELEPHYILDERTWEKVSCSSFLDNRRTGLIGRTLWIPDLPLTLGKHRRVWGEYCLLKRRESSL